MASGDVTSGATKRRPAPGTVCRWRRICWNVTLRRQLPNQVWTADITYLWTDEGWLYLAIVLDLFNREVIGWSIKARMTADIVTDALTMAWFHRKPAAGVAPLGPGQSVRQRGVAGHAPRLWQTCAMSRKGNCWDNAPTESWFNSFNNERAHGTPYATRAEATADAFDYIEVFYNRKRRHSTLGYKAPIQYLDDWISAQYRNELVARINPVGR